MCPSCSKVYPCRICHDDVENHELDRFAVEKIVCSECNEIQKKQNKCEKCEVVFGTYFCSICSLFDDEDRQQFHCDGCGLCRVGGRENFYHCDKCDMCLAVDLKNKHKCIEKSSHSNCAVCLENLHSSRIAAHIPHCGHLIHSSCYERMMKTGNYACPLCGEAMVDMHDIWKQLDEEIAHCPMPEEYKDYHVQILCKDCHKESNIIFHVLGLKCAKCGSYNTCRAADPDPANKQVPGHQTSHESSLDHIDPEALDSRNTGGNDSQSNTFEEGGV